MQFNPVHSHQPLPEGLMLDATLERILLINFGGLGDEILFFPVIQHLRAHYPAARITALVEPRCRNIMEHNHLIDEVFTFDIKSRKHPGDLLELVGILRDEAPDMIISSGGSTLVAGLLFLSGARYRVGYDSGRLRFLLTHRAPLNKEQYAAKMYYDLLLPLGFPDYITPEPEMKLPAMVDQWVVAWFKRQQVPLDEPYVLIHPGVSLLSKQKQLIKSWENHKWEALIRQLLEEGTRVVLAGGPDDADELAYLQARLSHPKLVSTYGHTRNMYQLGGFIRRAGVMVCVDSAPLHLGVAVNANIVTIFGPTDEQKLLPMHRTNLRVIHTDVACRPCLWATRQTTCEALTCLQEIGVERVYNAVREFVPRPIDLNQA